MVEPISDAHKGPPHRPDTVCHRHTRSYFIRQPPLPPIFFSSCTKHSSAHMLNIQFKQPILCRDALALEKVQKHALKFVKGPRHVPYETVLKQVCLFSLTLANPWRPNSHVQDYPWSLGISHGVHLRTSNPQMATPPRLQLPPTVMLYAPSPIRPHNSSCHILEQNTVPDSQRLLGEIFQNSPGCPLVAPVPRSTPNNPPSLTTQSLSTHQST